MTNREVTAEVAIQGSVIAVVSGAFEAPRAAAIVGPLAASERVRTIELLLEMGADHYLSARNSASVKLMEAQVEGLVEGLDEALEERLGGLLAADRQAARQENAATILKFSTDLSAMLNRYVDPSSADGLPAVATARLEEVARATIARVDAMLADGDTGLLAKQGDRIIKALRDEVEMLKRQVVEGQARARLGTAKGRSFEEELSRVLGSICTGLGAEVIRCGDHPGLKGRKYGDHLITVEGPMARGESIKIAIEAKDREAANGRFTVDSVRLACRQACDNRGATSAIFVADTADLLPDGRSFGTIDNHFFLAYDPAVGDDTALAATVHMAVSRAILDLVGRTGTGVDTAAANRELVQLRRLLEDFDAVEAAHSSAIKAIRRQADRRQQHASPS
jgi:hypothetical protein